MPKSRFFVFLLTLAGLLMVAAVVSAEIINVSIDDTINTAQTISGRLFRDADPSDCLSSKPFPGPFNVGTQYGYNVYGPYEALTGGCITVNFDPNPATNACGTNAHAQAFLDGFEPFWGGANDTNFLGDVGSSVTQPFSFNIAAGQTFVIVVTNTSGNAACNFHFDFSYDAEPTAPVAGPGCTLPVPAGSVVGDLPFATQAYYEPGNEAPGVVLNAGTYIVTGQDATETYYQIVLACQFVWVRKDMMQPSFQPPQNGAALPTTIIDPPATDAGSAGPASDV